MFDSLSLWKSHQNFMKSREWWWSQLISLLMEEKTTRKLSLWQDEFYLHLLYKLSSMQSKGITFLKKRKLIIPFFVFPSTFHIAHLRKELKDCREEAIKAKLQTKQHCWWDVHIGVSSLQICIIFFLFFLQCCLLCWVSCCIITLIWGRLY